MYFRLFWRVRSREDLFTWVLSVLSPRRVFGFRKLFAREKRGGAWLGGARRGGVGLGLAYGGSSSELVRQFVTRERICGDPVGDVSIA